MRSLANRDTFKRESCLIKQHAGRAGINPDGSPKQGGVAAPGDACPRFPLLLISLRSDSPYTIAAICPPRVSSGSHLLVPPPSVRVFVLPMEMCG